MQLPALCWLRASQTLLRYYTLLKGRLSIRRQYQAAGKQDYLGTPPVLLKNVGRSPKRKTRLYSVHNVRPTL